MNEKLNLAEILKDCPKGTKLYSPVWGEVYFEKILGHPYYAISINTLSGNKCLTKEGCYIIADDTECIIFPSKEQRDWSKFKVKSNKPKFDPKTLKPYDKVLVRDGDLGNWKNVFFSYIIERETCYPYLCLYDHYKYCIPYNDDTKHLVGTAEEAPEFYRYWEE